MLFSMKGVKSFIPSREPFSKKNSKSDSEMKEPPFEKITFKTEEPSLLPDNVAADHLSQIDKDETSGDSDVDDNFPGETLMEITTNDTGNGY
ncbi:hypothetical protein Tco_1286178 [Tanacetum coccineum]